MVPYFNKWVARWPTVAELAAASVEEVNTMWAGLGYYRRARGGHDGKAGGESATSGKHAGGMIGRQAGSATTQASYTQETTTCLCLGIGVHLRLSAPRSAS